MDFTQSMDNGYMIPTSVAVGSGEATDIRCVCDTVEDFKSFLDATDMELRYEGLVTYEKVNKLLKVYKGNDTWQTVGEVDLSNLKITIDMINGVEFMSNVEIPNISVTGVTMDKNITVNISNKSVITASIMPLNATNKRVFWSVNNSNISIVPNGLTCEIQGEALGSSIITVTTEDGSHTATCNVIVSNNVVSVQSISLNKSSSSLKIGESEQLSVNFVPSNATNKNIVWTSSHTDVITVEDGLVKAIAKGNGTITVTSQDGNKIAMCDYTILDDEQVEVTGNIFDKSTMLANGKVVINGAIVASANFNYCLIPVKSNSQYAIQKANTWEDNHYKPALVGQLGYMSDENTLISSVDMITLTKTSDGKGVTFTTPDECNYIMLSLQRTDLGDNLQVENGDTIHNYYQAFGGVR